MPLKLWTYDLAREQSPRPEHLDLLCRRSLEAGYDALGIYAEHRLAWPSAPWAHGLGAVPPSEITRLRREFPGLQLIPFVNVLAHVEGFLYTAQGKRFAEERFKGLSGCPSHAEFADFGRGVVRDALEIFDSEIVHLGGDETAQLGACSECASLDKSALYGEFYAPLIAMTREAGRRPALWGDMLLEHPSAMTAMDRQCLIFDWQYFTPFEETMTKFEEAGFEVVCSPTLHLYNSTWMNLNQAERNVRDAVATGRSVCVTTWEAGLMGNYETVLPAVEWAGRLMNGQDGPLVEAYGEWGRLMGVELPALGGMFAEGKIRSSLKVRLLLMANPFLAWLHHREEFCGALGDEALKLADLAHWHAQSASERGVATFLKKAVEFVRQAELAAVAYEDGRPGEATAALAPARQIFDELEKVAMATHLNIGGSLADVERCRQAKRWVEAVILRIKEYGGGSLGYLPSFEVISHPRFTPHDQGCWWLINKWAHE